jgi:ribosome-binding factor A
MSPEEIKLKRTESVLKEILPEAFGTLDDIRINRLGVTDVLCSRGRYDARVFLDPAGLNEQEQSEALKQLRMVGGHLSTYVRDSEGWYRAPKFTFEFDDQLERIDRMEALFDQIAQRKSKEDT